MTPSYTDQAAIIVGVATKYNIPVTALLGIYGQETNFGQHIATSNAGAVGPFQFIPSTAQQYGYPLTNNPNLSQFKQQADAWGRYLVANNPSRNPTGWAPAMRGGYTEAQAEANLAHLPAALKNAVASVVGGLATGPGTSVPGTTVTGTGPLGQIAGAVSSVASSVGDVGSAIGNVAGLVTSGSFWLRVLEGLGGIILLALGLITLTGHSAGDVAAVAARV